MKITLTDVELAARGITKINRKTGRACFMGVDMAIETTIALSGDDDNVKKSEKQAVDVTRDETDKRLEKYLAARGKFQDRCLADPKIGLLPSDLERMSDKLADDGHVYSEFRHVGKPRTGEPNIKYGGFTGGELKAHNVTQFVKLAPNAAGNGWLKNAVETAKSGAAMCDVDHKPYAGQKNADDNHSWAGCQRGECTANCHGDNADRGATYGKRGEWGARGWHIERADGSRENLADLNWDTTA